MNQSAIHQTRAAVGDPWWEYELFHALLDLDTDRLARLVDLAEADERARQLPSWLNQVTA